jgi:prophage antirepressor-like protein
VERDSEWWAVLADVADALDLDARHINERLTEQFVSKFRVPVCDVVSNDVTSKKARKTQDMLVVNEFGLYEAILESRKPEAKAMGF